jgi:hypothetical protein
VCRHTHTAGTYFPRKVCQHLSRTGGRVHTDHVYQHINCSHPPFRVDLTHGGVWSPQRDRSAPPLQSSGSTYCRQGRTHPRSMPVCKRTTSPIPLQSDAQGVTVEEVRGPARISVTCTENATPTSLAIFEVSLCTRKRLAPDWAQQMLRASSRWQLVPIERELCPSCPAGFFDPLVYSPFLQDFRCTVWRWHRRGVHPPSPSKNRHDVTSHMTSFTFLWGQGGRWGNRDIV